jgi:hypothetical protein
MAFDQAILVLAVIGFIVLFIGIASWCACRRFPTTQLNSEHHIPLTVNRRHNPEQRVYLRQVREQNVLHVSEEIHAATTVNVVNDGRRRHVDGTSLCGEYPDEDYEEEEEEQDTLFSTTQPNSEHHIPLTVNARHNDEQRAYLHQVRD